MSTQDLNFTIKNLKAIPNAPKGKREQYRDVGGRDSVHRLMLRVTDSGAKSFFVRKRVDGRGVRVTLGQFPDMTVDQAREEALNALSTMAGGDNPVEAKRERVAAAERKLVELMSVRDVLDEYKEHSGIRATTASGYTSALNTVLGTAMDRPIADITTKDIMAYHRAYSSKARANHAMRALRALFNWYHDSNDIDRVNPVSKALSPSKRGQRSRWHKVGRRKTWVDFLPEWFDAVEMLPHAGSRSAWIGDTAMDLFLFQMLTGLRSRAECASLTRDQVDFKAGTVTYRVTKTTYSTDEPLVIPLNLHALEILTRRPDGEYFFSKGNSWLDDTRNYVKKVRTKTGSEWTPYDSRRTFLTVGESLSTPILTLKRLVNHATVEHDVTSGYIGRDLETMRKWTQKIGDEIMRRANRLSAEIVELELLHERR